MARCFVSAGETGVVDAKTVAMRPAVTSAGFDVDGDSGGCWSVGHGLIVGDGGICGVVASKSGGGGCQGFKTTSVGGVEMGFEVGPRLIGFEFVVPLA